jgi:hypothetical protein
MKSTRVRNLCTGPLTIPGLISMVIPPGESAILTATPAEVIAALGGEANTAKLAEVFEESYDYPDSFKADLALASSLGARLALKAGTNDVAPIKLTAGDMVDVPQDGALEFDGIHFYVSIGGARYQVDQQSGGGGPTQLITALGVTPTEAEVGATVTNPAFTAAYSRPITTASINDGSGPTALTPPATSFSKTGTYTKTVVNATQAFTLAAQVDLEPVQSRAVSVTWRPKVFYGVAVPAAYDEAFIEALASSALASARQRTIAYVAGPTDKLYYCYPDSYGGVPANFVDASTGWQAGFSKVATVTVTNAHGVAISYAVWESDQSGLGSVSIQVL